MENCSRPILAHVNISSYYATSFYTLGPDSKEKIVLQLNRSTTATLGTEESGHCEKVVVVEKF